VKENYELRRNYIHSWPETTTSAKDTTIFLKIFSWDGPEDATPPDYPNAEGKLRPPLPTDPTN